MRHAKALAELEARWANLRIGPKSLTEREAHELAVVAHDRWLEMHRDNPSQQAFWDIELGDRVFAPSKRLTSTELDHLFDLSTIAVDDTATKIFQMEEWCLQARQTTAFRSEGSSSMITAAEFWLALSPRRSNARA